MLQKVRRSIIQYTHLWNTLYENKFRGASPKEDCRRIYYNYRHSLVTSSSLQQLRAVAKGHLLTPMGIFRFVSQLVTFLVVSTNTVTNPIYLKT
jgi:hypothetical protein